MKLAFYKIFLILAGLIFIFSCQKEAQQNRLGEQKETPHRIISLSPHVTEIIYALNLQDRLVGVTDFCKYPAEAHQKPHVGGFLNPNFEAIATLKPDIVFLLPEQQNVKNYLNQLKIAYRVVNNKTISDILQSIRIVGETCNAENQAKQLIDSLKSHIRAIEKLTRNLPRPKVLLTIGRTLGSGTLADIYAAGKNTFYTELIRIAGGKNVLSDEIVAYPLLSGEGIINLNPDIIIDIIYGAGVDSLQESTAKQDWNSLVQVNAVKNGSVFVINDSYAVIPGPRFIQLLDTLLKIIHPHVLKDEYENFTN